jgi:hypothetical protein
MKYLLGLGWSRGRDVVRLVVVVPCLHTEKWNGCSYNFNLELDELRSGKKMLIPMEAWVQKFVMCLMIRLNVEEPTAAVD